jgi:peptidoglycan/xylan/chitin deacetylase (PgdA/CDA1 family)
LKKIFPDGLVWKIPTEANEIFLTFDDGPHPSITPFVLDQLSAYNAKATFFCIGENVKRYQNVYLQILDGGHATGNHTYNHLNGWKTSDDKYLENIAEAKKLIDGRLFRPPYGRITRSQAHRLKPMFKIIMWDVVSGDFDTELPADKCLRNVIDNTVAGSIVVFHDSEKAFPRMEYALPRALDYFATKGFVMKALPKDF